MLQAEGSSSQGASLLHENTQLQAHCKVLCACWGFRHLSALSLACHVRLGMPEASILKTVHFQQWKDIKQLKERSSLCLICLTSSHIVLSQNLNPELEHQPRDQCPGKVRSHFVKLWGHPTVDELRTFVDMNVWNVLPTMLVVTLIDSQAALSLLAHARFVPITFVNEQSARLANWLTV
jgi:hypothetical protein